jgi:hypothetical protein
MKLAAAVVASLLLLLLCSATPASAARLLRLQHHNPRTARQQHGGGGGPWRRRLLQAGLLALNNLSPIRIQGLTLFANSPAAAASAAAGQDAKFKLGPEGTLQLGGGLSLSQGVALSRRALNPKTDTRLNNRPEAFTAAYVTTPWALGARRRAAGPLPPPPLPPAATLPARLEAASMELHPSAQTGPSSPPSATPSPRRRATSSPPPTTSTSSTSSATTPSATTWATA